MYNDTTFNFGVHQIVVEIVIGKVIETKSRSETERVRMVAERKVESRRRGWTRWMGRQVDLKDWGRGRRASSREEGKKKT